MEMQNAVFHVMLCFSLVFPSEYLKSFSKVLTVEKTFPSTLALRVGTPELS